MNEKYDHKKVSEMVEEVQDQHFSEHDNRVFRPSHYSKWTMEPMTFLALNNVSFLEGCVIKYVMRWRDKNGIEDLQKARRVIDMMIEMEENRQDYIAKKTCL